MQGKLGQRSRKVEVEEGGKSRCWIWRGTGSLELCGSEMEIQIKKGEIRSEQAYCNSMAVSHIMVLEGWKRHKTEWKWWRSDWQQSTDSACSVFPHFPNHASSYVPKWPYYPSLLTLHASHETRIPRHQSDQNQDILNKTCTSWLCFSFLNIFLPTLLNTLFFAPAKQLVDSMSQKKRRKIIIGLKSI